jgi:SAM-dependent methyltransferase
MKDAMPGMDDRDRAETFEKYRKGYEEYGYSPKTLGWDKGRQDIRFEVLLSFFECRGKSILDIGCGFGDLNRVLARRSSDSYHYTGNDLVGDLIDEGRRQYPQEHIRFLNVDFLEYPLMEKFDIIVASGIFNQKFTSGKNDLFVKRVLKKAWSLCKEGLAFDFLSDKVDYRHDHTYHNNPERILGLAYGLSRNVVLRNDYMPFEFCLYVGKNDSFDSSDAVFNIHKQRTGRG